jgi:hypothetical protein
MAPKRSFSADDIPTKSADYHGLASYLRTSPDVAAQGVQSINVYLTFDEAVKLSVALQSCVLSLNRYNRRKKAGKDMGLLLSFKTATGTVTVIEANVTNERRARREQA